MLEGEFRIKVGEDLFQVGKGDSVFGPRMIPHTFEKIGNGPGRLLMVFQPAGKMQDFFEKTASGYTKTLSPEELDRFRQEHGLKQVGPPLSKPKTIGG